jgi:hypothetical protein
MKQLLLGTSLVILISMLAGCSSSGGNEENSQKTATLNWGPSPVGASNSAPDGYKIYHSTTPGGPYQYYDQVGNVLTYQAKNLQPGTHCFAVTAFNSKGESDFSPCNDGDCCKTIP